MAELSRLFQGDDIGTLTGNRVVADYRLVQALETIWKFLEADMTGLNLFQGEVSALAEIAETSVPTTICSAVATNLTGGAITLQVWVAMDGGAAANANKVYDAISVSANSQADLPLLENMKLPRGAKIHAQASGNLTITISGVQ